jgi:hypothetical protein
MQINFTVGDAPAEFLYSSATGKAELRLGQETIELQNPLRLSSQFSFSQTKSWTTEAAGHAVAIVKQRPVLAAGFRKSSFTVSVDGDVVAEVTGR